MWITHATTTRDFQLSRSSNVSYRDILSCTVDATHTPYLNSIGRPSLVDSTRNHEFSSDSSYLRDCC
jgi:hypothetical protein